MKTRGARISIGIIGGGYAGIASAIELHKTKTPVSVTLFDGRDKHQKITQWHKLARGEAPAKYETAFSSLAGRFDFEFYRISPDIAAVLTEPEAALGRHFDAIIIAQGSHSPVRLADVVSLDALRDDVTIQKQVRSVKAARIAVIGGGPTGVQFAFEFAARGNTVELYEARERLLPTFDDGLSQAAMRAAEKGKIGIRLNTEFVRFDRGKVFSRSGAREVVTEADMVLFVPGVRSTPAFTCDVYGRIENHGVWRHRGKTAFYAAGDNSYFSGRGLNTKSAQAAVRKGQHVAQTLLADLGRGIVREYTYGEIGYFVSLGPYDAVGYLFSQKTAFSGPAALLMKEAIEKQYNLYLAGFNVYP